MVMKSNNYPEPGIARPRVRTARMPVADILSFSLSWIRNPLRVAAVAPSGPAVAALMTQEITAETGPVIELGPGTGPFMSFGLQY